MILHTLLEELEKQAPERGRCSGSLLDVRGRDGRIWYRCEHVQHCEDCRRYVPPAALACHFMLTELRISSAVAVTVTMDILRTSGRNPQLTIKIQVLAKNGGSNGPIVLAHF